MLQRSVVTCHSLQSSLQCLVEAFHLTVWSARICCQLYVSHSVLSKKLLNLLSRTLAHCPMSRPSLCSLEYLSYWIFLSAALLSQIIKQLRGIFSRTGIPNCIVTDSSSEIIYLWRTCTCHWNHLHPLWISTNQYKPTFAHEWSCEIHVYSLECSPEDLTHAWEINYLG